MVVTRTIKKELPDVKGASFFDSRKYIGKKQLQDATKELSEIEDIHDTNVLEVVFSKDFFNSDIKTIARYFDELITGKRLKSAQKKLHEEEMLLLAAKRMYELTGEQKGKSGIVKNEKIADAKSAKFLQSVKIAAAMALAYGKDDSHKKEIMLTIKTRYPELVSDIKSLVEKAKARIKQDEFRRATAGMKFGNTEEKNIVSNRIAKKVR